MIGCRTCNHGVCASCLAGGGTNVNIVMQPCRGWHTRIRAGPSFDKNQVGLIPNGEKVKFVKILNGWAKVAPEEYERVKRWDCFKKHDPKNEGWCALKSQDGEQTLQRVLRAADRKIEGEGEYVFCAFVLLLILSLVLAWYLWHK